jgi:ADP-ribose pyrophosphatase YjhB (NUDIX family)
METSMDQTSTVQDDPQRRARPLASSAALIRNDIGEILMVQPTYKESLEPPGGFIEIGEHPTAACLREVREELGIDIELGGLLVADWAPYPNGGDIILFIFDGGRLTRDQEASINLRVEEVSSYAYYSLPQIQERTPSRLSRRIIQAAQASAPRYLEDGAVPDAALW